MPGWRLDKAALPYQRVMIGGLSCCGHLRAVMLLASKFRHCNGSRDSGGEGTIMGDQEETGQQPTEESTSTATGSTAEPEPEAQDESKGSDKKDGPVAQPDNKYQG